MEQMYVNSAEERGNTFWIAEEQITCIKTCCFILVNYQFSEFKMEVSKPYGYFSHLINISKGCALHEAVNQLSWFLWNQGRGLGYSRVV